MVTQHRNKRQWLAQFEKQSWRPSHTTLLFLSNSKHNTFPQHISSLYFYSFDIIVGLDS